MQESRFAVHFEDGHKEEFAANEVQYAGGGIIIQKRTVTVVGSRLNPNSGRLEDQVEVSQELRAVFAPPRADMAPSRRWWRVESIPVEPSDIEEAPAPPALEVVN